MKKLLPLVGLTVMVASAGATLTVEVNPAATYLRTDGIDDTPSIDTVAIDLFSYGFTVGQSVKLTSLGLYYNSWPDMSSTDKYMRGVFSSFSTLLPNPPSSFDPVNRLNDVLVAVGGDDDSGPSMFANGTSLPMDIPQDFFIHDGGVILTIPGQYLFVAASDTAYSDNVQNADDPLRLTIEAVPEPSTVIAGACMLLPFGVSALRKLRKNRA